MEKTENSSYQPNPITEFYQKCDLLKITPEFSFEENQYAVDDIRNCRHRQNYPPKDYKSNSAVDTSTTGPDQNYSISNKSRNKFLGPLFKCTVKFEDHSVTSQPKNTKKEAKRDACIEAFENPIFCNNEKLAEAKKNIGKKKTKIALINMDIDESVESFPKLIEEGYHPKSLLNHYMNVNRDFKVKPEFYMDSRKCENSDINRFVCKISVDGWEPIISKAPSVKNAEHEAVKVLLSKLALEKEHGVYYNGLNSRRNGERVGEKEASLKNDDTARNGQ
ncbi:hypothetical protein H4219_005148 [Mycoemilia scoparia]|uniref:DRBM domain-containing protein n=1 Tax=Mycoemilia scoparia TaxID=417184 RepID=A0A9W7ZP26_9FUNG|nr:hypothetical protein H4219_005148 [Mycoemilia scoparia]